MYIIYYKSIDYIKKMDVELDFIKNLMKLNVFKK